MHKGGKGHKLCPISLGLAIGLVSGLAMFIWALWLMYFGASPMMAEYNLPVPTFKAALILLLAGFAKGFLFGFFVALFYDCIICWCKNAGYCSVCSKGNCSCCKGDKCDCSCGCCKGDKCTCSCGCCQGKPPTQNGMNNPTR